MDRLHIRVIPEWFGGGSLPRNELHEAAEELAANQAELIVVGEPAIEKGLDKALVRAAKVGGGISRICMHAEGRSMPPRKP